MNQLHLILAAILETAQTGGLSEELSERTFNALSGYLEAIPPDAVQKFKENLERILKAQDG